MRYHFAIRAALLSSSPLEGRCCVVCGMRTHAHDALNKASANPFFLAKITDMSIGAMIWDGDEGPAKATSRDRTSHTRYPLGRAPKENEEGFDARGIATHHDACLPLVRRRIDLCSPRRNASSPARRFGAAATASAHYGGRRSRRNARTAPQERSQARVSLVSSRRIACNTNRRKEVRRDGSRRGQRRRYVLLSVLLFPLLLLRKVSRRGRRVVARFKSSWVRPRSGLRLRSGFGFRPSLAKPTRADPHSDLEC